MKYTLLLILVSLAVYASASTTTDIDFLQRSWKQTPQMQIQDAYKWLYHANLGAEHAIKNEDDARAWMDKEWDEIGQPMKGEKLIVPLREDGKLVRVNLRPAKTRGLKQVILKAFIASAREYAADKSMFIKDWQTLGQELEKHRIMRMTFRDWQTLDNQMKSKGYPAIHHSKHYEELYKPAYRVILAKFITKQWQPN